MTPRLRTLLAAAFAALALTGCADDLEVADRRAGPLVAEVVVEGFEFPTQLFIGAEHWYLAQLSGAENDATGTVVRIDPNDVSAEPELVLEGLDKPTGVAVFADELWVMERRRLTRGPLDGSTREVVVDEMAFNGRSQGTLTVDGERLLFNTSGSLRSIEDSNSSPMNSSGVLWSVDASGTIAPVASGFKHAYAHARGADGTLWSTEMTDGTFDGSPAEDEVVAVVEGRDHGWPRCVGNNRPVVERDANEATCAVVPESQALFDAGATPTSIVVAPWNDHELLVSLWNRGEIVSVPIEPQLTPAAGAVIYAGIERPQHLTLDGDRLLLVDFLGGRIVELARAT
ncbi:MAG: glucose sorbosone dehydrogenase [Acidimicrobiia bacterium]|nr:glucose sorbosone dehydrogenase [Acidimicrobiia bacterium]